MAAAAAAAQQHSLRALPPSQVLLDATADRRGGLGGRLLSLWAGLAVARAHGAAAVYTPCLFNESTDLREQEDLSLAPANAALLRDMEGQLSREALAAFTSRTPAEMLGKCDATCAKKYWKSLGSTAGNGPICGVPGCSYR